MSSENQMDGENWPFGPNGPQGFDLNALFAMFQSDPSGPSGPINWETARQLAAQLCTQDPDEYRDSDPNPFGMVANTGTTPTATTRPDPSVEPTRANYIASLVQAAQSQIAAITGLSESTGVPCRCVTRAEWTLVTLDGLRPVLESLAQRMAVGFDGVIPDSEGPEAEMLSGLIKNLMPQMFGMQAGSLAGLLSHHALGQFDLPLPLAAPPQLAFVVSNMEKFAADWTLPFEELAYALAVRESVHAAQRSVGWVRDRLVRLCTEYVDGYELQLDAFEQQMPDEYRHLEASGEDFNPFELMNKLQSGELPGLQMEPQELLAGMRSERQAPLLAELQRFAAVLEGYADVVIDTIDTHNTANHSRIEEALRRHRVERGAAADFVDTMLGLQLGRDEYEQGQTFCAGVIERGGIEALNRLWERESHLPTAPEFAAPGLWMARIELDLDN